jgi:hypothetical protein
MAFYVFNYQIGDPDRTYPRSLILQSSAYGVSINTLAPNDRYIAFNAAMGPIPSGGYTADTTLYTADNTIITADVT